MSTMHLSRPQSWGRVGWGVFYPAKIVSSGSAGAPTLTSPGSGEGIGESAIVKGSEK